MQCGRDTEFLKSNTMRIANRQFEPRLWAILLYAAVLACMLWLGNWQLERAALKVSLQQAADVAREAAPVALQSVQDMDSASASYQRTVVQGAYDTERQFLWDNRTHKGRAGFEVISLLRLTDGGTALINRGWVPAGPDRQTFPDIDFPDSVSGVTVSFEGLLSRPSKGFASGEAITGGEGWPKLLQFFDYTAIAGASGEPIVPVLVQTQELGADASTSTVLTSRPEWYAANWQPAASGPAKHYSYAFQWFAMAIALTGIFLVVNSRRCSPNSNNS